MADENNEVADAYVTLCVHAGIAAPDVICCASLGEHAQGENHSEAIGPENTAAGGAKLEQRCADREMGSAPCSTGVV